HILPSVLPSERALPAVRRSRLRREWRPAPLDTGVVHLPEAIALVVGVGGVGSETARLREALGRPGMRIDARRREAPPGVFKLEGPDALDALLPEADFVILTVPH